MLRLTNPDTIHRVPIMVGGEETVFYLKSKSVGQRMKWLAELQSTQITEENAVETYPRTMELVAGLISSIEGHEDITPLEALERMDSQSDIMDVMNGVIGFSSVSDAEAKNLESSSAPPVSASVGTASVGTIVETDGERVLTIPPMEVSEPEIKECENL